MFRYLFNNVYFRNYDYAVHSNRQERCIVKLSFDKKPSRLTEAPETAHCCSLMLFATCKLEFSNFDINVILWLQLNNALWIWVYIYTEKPPSETHFIRCIYCTLYLYIRVTGWWVTQRSILSEKYIFDKRNIFLTLIEVQIPQKDHFPLKNL